MATISDVARMAGVSVSTVSHVLNGTRHVSIDTKDAVMEAIATLSFVPNAVARSLARASTDVLGLAIPVTRGSGFNEIIAGIERRCGPTGKLAFRCDTERDPAVELRIAREFIHRRVDGVVLAPTTSVENAAIALLKANRLPLVLIDGDAGGAQDSVSLDQDKAMDLIVGHLAALGHERIAFLPGEPGLASTLERRLAFARSLDRHGLSAAPALIAADSASSAEALAAARDLLATTDRPSAFIAGSGPVAIGVMRVAAEIGLDIPRDLALVGFDDPDWSECVEPRLTAIADINAEIGAKAVELLLNRIRHPQADPVHVRLEPALVVRRSCGWDGILRDAPSSRPATAAAAHGALAN